MKPKPSGTRATGREDGAHPLVQPPDDQLIRLAAVHDMIVGCERCPRLRMYCQQIAHDTRRALRAAADWGRPVPAFGDPSARLLLVGLAPAAHGANRTGRV